MAVCMRTASSNEVCSQGVQGLDQGCVWEGLAAPQSQPHTNKPCIVQMRWQAARLSSTGYAVEHY
jgi:hypothetical protein